MSDGFFETVARRAKGTISHLGIAFACALPGASKAIEQPFLDVADAGRMVAGADLPSEEGRGGYLTDAIRAMGADDRKYKGKGELEDACKGGEFIGETVGTIVFGGPVTAVAKRGIRTGAKALFKAAAKHERKQQMEPNGMVRKAAVWAKDKAIKYGTGTAAGALAGGALDATKMVYTESHAPTVGPTGP